MLEAGQCFTGYENKDIESFIRMLIEQMRWSPLKCEAIYGICRDNPNISSISFYLWPMRYHDRWASLTNKDFQFMKLYRPLDTKGYWVKPFPMLNEGSPFCMEDMDSIPPSIMPDNMLLYLEKIVRLCKKNNITLILVKSPMLAWSVQNHKGIQNFADENKVAFYDFNTEELYNDIEYDYKIDGWMHLALSGAEKVTHKIGQILLSNYSVPQVSDKQWEGHNQ